MITLFILVLIGVGLICAISYRIVSGKISIKSLAVRVLLCIGVVFSTVGLVGLIEKLFIHISG